VPRLLEPKSVCDKPRLPAIVALVVPRPELAQRKSLQEIVVKLAPAMETPRIFST